MAMEGFLSRAFLKLHYMREHPVLSFGPLKQYCLLGKIQNEGQSAGNLFNYTSSSETTREALILRNNYFLY